MNQTAKKNELQVEINEVVKKLLGGEIKHLEAVMNKIYDLMIPYLGKKLAKKATQEILHVTNYCLCSKHRDAKYREYYVLKQEAIELLNKYLKKEDEIKLCQEYLFEIGTGREYLDTLELIYIINRRRAFSNEKTNSYPPDLLNYL